MIATRSSAASNVWRAIQTGSVGRSTFTSTTATNDPSRLANSSRTRLSPLPNSPLQNQQQRRGYPTPIDPSPSNSASPSSYRLQQATKKWRPPPPKPDQYSAETISGPSTSSLTHTVPSTRPHDNCCTECIELPRARRERHAKRLQARAQGAGAAPATRGKHTAADADSTRGNAASSSEQDAASAPGGGSHNSNSDDSRPFYKKYPPPAKSPEPITFDQPAIPNPGVTAEAQARFKRTSKVAGGVFIVLLAVVGGLWATGSFEGVTLLDAPAQGLLGKDVVVSVVGDKQVTKRGSGDRAVIGAQAQDVDTQVQASLASPPPATLSSGKSGSGAGGGGSSASYTLLTLQRSSTIAKAVVLCLWDYRRTLQATYTTRTAELEALRQCHLRSAHRVLRALQVNGGVYIKLGQHASAVLLLPVEWTETLKPLQDQNTPTPLDKLEPMFKSETGMSFDEAFSEIDPRPIGVASLAQVHRAVDRKTGMRVAVKMMHPDVERFCEVDMRVSFRPCTG